jgi:uncharacterized protein Yka (UPF0111/DUF47 family)
MNLDIHYTERCSEVYNLDFKEHMIHMMDLCNDTMNFVEKNIKFHKDMIKKYDHIYDRKMVEDSEHYLDQVQREFNNYKVYDC